MKAEIYEHVTMTLTWGCDEAQQVFERFEVRRRRPREGGELVPPPASLVAAVSPISPKSNESPE
jgi:hypothetical protein